MNGNYIKHYRLKEFIFNRFVLGIAGNYNRHAASGHFGKNRNYTDNSESADFRVRNGFSFDMRSIQILQGPLHFVCLEHL